MDKLVDQPGEIHKRFKALLERECVPVIAVEVEEAVSVTVHGKGLTRDQEYRVYDAQLELMQEFPDLLIDFRLVNHD